MNKPIRAYILFRCTECDQGMDAKFDSEDETWGHMLNAIRKIGWDVRTDEESQVILCTCPKCSKPDEIVNAKICSHYDDDFDMTTACDQKATHYSCCYGFNKEINVCKLHKCRCSHE